MNLTTNPRNTVISHFVCPKCGIDMPIPRKRNKQRKADHKKALYCPRCKSRENFAEYTYKTAYKNMDGDILQ